MVVAAVPGVDDGHQRVPAGHQGRALLGVAHGDDVRVAGHGAHGVRHALPLAGTKIVLVSPEELKLPSYVKKEVLQKNGIPYTQTTDLPYRTCRK